MGKGSGNKRYKGCIAIDVHDSKGKRNKRGKDRIVIKPNFETHTLVFQEVTNYHEGKNANDAYDDMYDEYEAYNHDFIDLTSNAFGIPAYTHENNHYVGYATNHLVPSQQDSLYAVHFVLIFVVICLLGTIIASISCLCGVGAGYFVRKVREEKEPIPCV